jgi:hypothetical protein
MLLRTKVEKVARAGFEEVNYCDQPPSGMLRQSALVVVLSRAMSHSLAIMSMIAAEEWGIACRQMRNWQLAAVALI